MLAGCSAICWEPLSTLLAHMGLVTSTHWAMAGSRVNSCHAFHALKTGYLTV